MLGPAVCLLAVPLVGCNAMMVMILIVMSMFFYGFLTGGEIPLLCEYSQDLSGTIFGIMNTFGSLSGILGSQITSSIIQTHVG